jgi:hypothetical protein
MRSWLAINNGSKRAVELERRLDVNTPPKPRPSCHGLIVVDITVHAIQCQSFLHDERAMCALPVLMDSEVWTPEPVDEVHSRYCKRLRPAQLLSGLEVRV